MGQSVFLLFDRTSRLTRVTLAATTFGSVDPRSMFFPSEEDARGHRAIELDPRIVERIRPEVWQKLCGHSVYTASGLQVDDFDSIEKRVRKGAIAQSERLLLDYAAAFASVQAASNVIGETLPTADRIAAAHARSIESERSRLAGLRSHEIPVPVDKILSDLAGKRLPL